MNNENQQILEKEIDLIQNCINRMAHNSFIIKGWLITIVAVILALMPETINVRILCIVVILITCCFWYLDSYFLKMERLYRWKYNWVIRNRYKTKEYSYNLAPINEKMWLPDRKTGQQRKEPNIIRVMFTKTLTPLYIPILVVTICILINDLIKLNQ